MSRSSGRRLGAAMATAVLALTACGGGDAADSDAAPTPSSAAGADSDAAPTSSDGDGSDAASEPGERSANDAVATTAESDTASPPPDDLVVLELSLRIIAGGTTTSVMTTVEGTPNGSSDHPLVRCELGSPPTIELVAPDGDVTSFAIAADPDPVDTEPSDVEVDEGVPVVVDLVVDEVEVAGATGRLTELDPGAGAFVVAGADGTVVEGAYLCT